MTQPAPAPPTPGDLAQDMAYTAPGITSITTPSEPVFPHLNAPVRIQ
ncbi:hypothetical protein [Deinococcus arenicola]|uniref:Uncharacterized protein n=1 Tax=Deinococcus arenicola TaxID=2994950 RepID=A0ABU4DL03_9DEIO|nr:hypothetical protein [Deinococcus sp. ZS9-10]MDV6373119.1 hypothetical protein [Deinococcus sp. ZS9-10]